MTLKSITQQLPMAEVRDLAEVLLERGLSPVDAADQIVEFLDGVVDWTKVVKGPAGLALEAGDGPLIRGIVRVIVGSAARRRKG